MAKLVLKQSVKAHGPLVLFSFKTQCVERQLFLYFNPFFTDICVVKFTNSPTVYHGLQYSLTDNLILELQAESIDEETTCLGQWMDVCVYCSRGSI